MAIENRRHQCAIPFTDDARDVAGKPKLRVVSFNYQTGISVHNRKHSSLHSDAQMRSSIWRHFAVLLGCSAIFLFLADLLTGAPTRAHGWSGAPVEALRGLSNSLYPMLGVIAAIAVGTARPVRDTLGQAIRVVLVATCLMLLLDVFTMPAQDSVLRAVVDLNGGSVRDVHVVLREYPTLHPRARAETAIVRAGMLLFPVLLVGCVLGLNAWMTDRVVFRFPRDAIVARWALALLFAPAAAALLLSWSSGYAYDILFRGQPLLLPLVPYLPAMACAAIGWRFAARTYRNDVETAGVRTPAA